VLGVVRASLGWSADEAAIEVFLPLRRKFAPGII
jgi:hypothetical protein